MNSTVHRKKKKKGSFCLGFFLWYINHCRLFLYQIHFIKILLIFMIWFGWIHGHINRCRLFLYQIHFIKILLIFMIWFGSIHWHINRCRLFNAKYSYKYYKYLWFGLLGFIGISTIIGYLVPFNIQYYKYLWFGLVGFIGISTNVGYLMPNTIHTDIINIYNLVWLDSLAYKPLWVI